MVTYCLKGCSNQSILNKNVSYHKVYIRWREKILHSYLRWKPQLLEKVSCKIGKKAENIFLHTRIKIWENFNIKHGVMEMEQNKFIQSNKKRDSRRDIQRISVVARCTVKKVSLKILPPAYLHIIKIDIK